jgi:hypothetical protein
MVHAAAQLIGRPTELDALEQALSRLAHGGPEAIEVVGEPGIGKTRLLAELRERGDARGYLVLSGTASELERDLPFWVFVDALDEYVESLEPGVLELLDESVRSELAQVLPALSASQEERLRHCRTSATARTARCATCSSCSPRGPRSSSCSTTCTGPTPARSSCSARCCAALRPRRCCSRSPPVPGRCPSDSRGRSSGHTVPARSRGSSSPR